MTVFCFVGILFPFVSITIATLMGINNILNSYKNQMSKNIVNVGVCSFRFISSNWGRIPTVWLNLSPGRRTMELLEGLTSS